MLKMIVSVTHTLRNNRTDDGRRHIQGIAESKVEYKLNQKAIQNISIELCVETFQ